MHAFVAFLCVACQIPVGVNQSYQLLSPGTPTCTELRNASNSIMHLVGEARVVLFNDKHLTVTTVLVSPELNHCALIGWQTYSACMSSLLPS